jgi:SAM-dependent methyltransferase
MGESVYEAIAAVYDRWMTHMDYEAIHARLLDLLGGHAENRRVLDVCTGTGSVLVELARSGATVTGLDRSAEMLEIATGKVELARADDRVSLRRCDVVGDDEWPAGPYDLILCVGDSVNYFDADELRCFVDRSSRVLSDTGALYIDVNSVHKLCDVFGSSVHAEEFDGCAYIWRNRLEADRTSIDFDITLFKQESGSDECWTRHTEHHTQYVHDLQSILDLLHGAGLTDVSVTEDYAGDAVQTADSWRWVIVARRPAGAAQ